MARDSLIFLFIGVWTFGCSRMDDFVCLVDIVGDDRSEDNTFSLLYFAFNRPERRRSVIS